MTNADHGELSLTKQGIQVLFGGNIQCTRGFIQDDEPGSIEQKATKSQSLLLPKRENPRPILFHLKIWVALQQTPQVDLLQNMMKLIVTEAGLIRWITELLTQRAKQHVGLLRDK